MADSGEDPPPSPIPALMEVTTTEVKENSAPLDVKVKVEPADTEDNGEKQLDSDQEKKVKIDDAPLQPTYLLVPDEMWWEISDSLSHSDMKNLRIIHPFLHKAYRGYRRFYDTSVMKLKNQRASIFENIIMPTYTWAEIELEILNGVFKTRVPEDFYNRYSEKITSISFLNCNIAIPGEIGPDRQYYLGEIVGRCKKLISLEVGATPHFLPPTDDENVIISKDTVWPSIKKVKFVRDSKFQNDMALYVLTRVKNLEELSIQGSSKEMPGTKSLAKNVTGKQKEQWAADASFIIDFIMPFIKRDEPTLKKLRLKYFYSLAKTQFVNEFAQRHPPELDNLDLTMCFLSPTQLTLLSTSLPKLKSISCALVPTTRCRHPTHEIKYLPKQQLPSRPKPLYKTPTSARSIGDLIELNISNSVSLDCLCFVGQMKKLMHLDCSYCPSIRNKVTLLNGNGPAFGPYLISKKKLKKEKKKEESRLKKKESDDDWGLTDEEKEGSSIKKTSPKLVIWKIKTFKFAGNMEAKLDVKRFILFNVVHLDLSFSDCIRENKDFQHICSTFRKLEILKISGSNGEFRLNRLKALKKLTELRLRSCRKIAPEQYEANIGLPLLKILDIADTQVNLEGLKNIVEKNRLLEHLDFRGCENIDIGSQAFQDFIPTAQHVSLRKGILEPKRKIKEKKEKLVKPDPDSMDTAEASVASSAPVKIENSDSDASAGESDAAKVENSFKIEVKSEKSPEGN